MSVRLAKSVILFKLLMEAIDHLGRMFSNAKNCQIRGGALVGVPKQMASFVYGSDCENERSYTSFE